MSDEIKSDEIEVVCVVPIKNESWILERFLDMTDVWADRIVILDHLSEDNSVEIARRFASVDLHRYEAEGFDEFERRRLLFDHARAKPGPRLLVAIDADEILAGDGMLGEEWERVLSAPPGTLFRARRYGILPGLKKCWWEGTFAFALVDDGTEFVTSNIHGARIPEAEGVVPIELENIVLLHLQYADWDRMKSKQRWYQCWETLNNSYKRPIQIYRQYHMMDEYKDGKLDDIPESWLEVYRSRGKLPEFRFDGAPYAWDNQVVDMILEHGAKRFRKVDIWDDPWMEAALRQSNRTGDSRFDDPRSGWEKAIFRWLRRTQPVKLRPSVRWAQRALRLLGW
jgi:hypothetical protein